MCGGSCGTILEAREKLLNKETRAVQDIVSEIMMLIAELNNSIENEEKKKCRG